MRLVESGRLASTRATHSVFPILTNKRVKIIKGKGAAWRT
jgi:hypothetical protein